MKYLISSMPLICGFILDLILGDPYNLPHPVRLMGKFISYLEKFSEIKCRIIFVSAALFYQLLY